MVKSAYNNRLSCKLDEELLAEMKNIIAQLAKAEFEIKTQKEKIIEEKNELDMRIKQKMDDSNTVPKLLLTKILKTTNIEEVK